MLTMIVTGMVQQNPDMVMVHYLNVPYNDDNKIINPTLNFADSKKEWTKEDLIAELKPMCKFVHLPYPLLICSNMKNNNNN